METFLHKAKEVIETVTYCNIASITPEGMPWNTPVYISYDKELNFYLMSWRNNQHSINIRNNENVFFTIYDSTAPAGTGFGVYFRGRAYEVNNLKEILTGLNSHYTRTKSKARSVAKFVKKFPRRMYKLIPEQAWINGDGKIEEEPIDIRMELNLADLKKLF